MLSRRLGNIHNVHFVECRCMCKSEHGISHRVPVLGWSIRQFSVDKLVDVSPTSRRSTDQKLQTPVVPFQTVRKHRTQMRPQPLTILTVFNAKMRGLATAIFAAAP